MLTSLPRVVLSRAGLLCASLGLFCALALTSVWLGRRMLASAELRGRTGALADVRRVADSTATQRVLQAQVLWLAQRHTDTVFVVTAAKAARAGHALAAIPRTLRDTLPSVVRVALDACDALVADTATLHAAIRTERVAARELFRLDTLAIDGLKAQVVTLRDEVQSLQRRPRWWKVLVGSAGTAAVAFVVGRSS